MISKFITGLLFGIILTQAFAQECDLNTYRINDVYFNDYILSYYISSFYGNSGKSKVKLFEYQITSDDPFCQNQTLYLSFDFKVHSPDLGFASFESFYSGTIIIDNIDNELYFGNNHISYEAPPIQNTQFNLIDYFGPDSFANDQAETLISFVSQAGRLPNGKYLFQFKLFADNDFNANPIHYSSKTIDVDVPIVLDLLSPGGGHSAIDDNFIYSTYPLFNWYADFCPNCQMGIRICEYDPDKHNSLNEAIQDASHLPFKQNTEYHTVSSLTNSFQYPAAGSISLEAGKLYVWQIRRSYETSVAAIHDFSPIFIFEIRKPEGSKKDISGSYFDVLKSIIGKEKFDLWFSSGGELERFNIQGDTILIDGEEVSVETLYSILSDIENEIITIKDVKLK